jgi:hypothetical protein
MSVSEFWSSTLREINNKIRGFIQIETERNRADWERVRWQTVNLLNIHIDEKHRYKRVYDLLMCPWEEDGIRKRLKEEREAAQAIFKKWDQKPVNK